VTVAFATADGTATAGSDYVARSFTLTFNAGWTAQTVSVVVNGDTLSEYRETAPELAETLFLNLSNPVNATLGDNQGAGSILDDDSLTIGDPTAVEGDSGTTALVFPVSLAGPLSSEVRVNYATANGTAVAGADYLAASGTLVFAPGETTKFITVTGLADRADEADEVVFVNLSSPVNIALTDTQAAGTFQDDDALPALAVGDVVVSEGNVGTKTVTFTVTLSAVSARAVTVAYATADGTGTAGSDYVTKSGTLTFNPGTTVQTVTVVLNGDLLVEGDESFFLNLLNPGNVLLADDQALATILNDDGTI
jgi:hypothetical protein